MNCKRKPGSIEEATQMFFRDSSLWAYPFLPIKKRGEAYSPDFKGNGIILSTNGTDCTVVFNCNMFYPASIQAGKAEDKNISDLIAAGWLVD